MITMLAHLQAEHEIFNKADYFMMDNAIENDNISGSLILKKWVQMRTTRFILDE